MSIAAASNSSRKDNILIDGRNISSNSSPRIRVRRLLAANVMLLLVDAIGAMAGYAISLRISGYENFDIQQDFALCVVSIYTVIAFIGGDGTTKFFESEKIGILRAVRAFYTAVLLVAFIVLLGGAAVGRIRGLLLFAGPIMCLGLLASRWLFAAYLWERRRRGGAVWPVTLVLCDGVPHISPGSGSTVIDVQAFGLVPDAGDPIALQRLGEVVAGADRVIVACGAARRHDWAVALKGANVDAEVIAEEIGGLRPMGTGDYRGVATIKVSAGPLGLHDRIAKRALDIFVSGCALIVLAPFLLLVAVLIRLDSPGPVLFRQQRIGRGNSLFYIHKFRSMRADQEDLTGGKLTTGRDDDRVTRVGRFIRATSIDELPQLLDVLRGSMSIVGPRPHALGAKAGDLLYWDVDRAYWHRHAVKPGITGLAQVRGFRGTTFTASDLLNRLESDIEYLSGWTLWRDVAIMISTVKVVAGSKAF